MPMVRSMITSRRGAPKGAPAPARAGGEAGFTLLEVMIAVLLSMIGLIGTVAVQQAAMNGTANANDAQVAMRLAIKSLEDFSTRRTQTNPFIDMLATVADGDWTAPVYLDAQGRSRATQTPANRWKVITRVVNLGINQPYNISVQVSYGLNSATPKTVRLDLERRKTW
jgi:Tfp pilus assembly protein PilV